MTLAASECGAAVLSRITDGSTEMGQAASADNEGLVLTFFQQLRTFTEDDWDAVSDRANAISPGEFNDACDIACRAAETFGDTRKIESQAWGIAEACGHSSLGAEAAAAVFEILGASKLAEDGVLPVFLPVFGYADTSDLRKV